MKSKRLKTMALCMAMFLCLGMVNVTKASENMSRAYSGTVNFNVTCTNVYGMDNPDPTTFEVRKSNTYTRFYMTLHTISQSQTLTFTAFRDNGNQVSDTGAIALGPSNIGIQQSAPYWTGTAAKYDTYYMYGMAPRNIANVNATGTYMP